MRSKIVRKLKRKTAIRAKISGTALVPRLNVFRSNTHIYASLIDDTVGKTLLSVGDRVLKEGKNQKKTEKAFAAGKLLAEKALKEKIKKVVFDRSGYLYHGRVKALAEGAREGGLEF
ncbi:MAG: 50S ribosomal protein L18 [bacterium]|nr:50S ribosomal protein L18 [bacterium]